ncbi:4-phosphopantetheinyl transferase, partial [Clavibacter californiensis]
MTHIVVARVAVDASAARPARTAVGRDALRSIAAELVGAHPADVTVR